MKQTIFLFLLSPFLIISQSASVFDASYFNMGNTTPLIEVGKGINITDVYKPTKHCFTVPIDQSKLKPTQSGQNTSIKYYYTKTETEYNSLKNQGFSGQISYLNLFSIGGSDNTSLSTTSHNLVERIVVVASVDFGVYALSSEPALKPEAKALITKSMYNEFVEQYGTHYINGVRKESSVWITLTKTSSSQKTKSTTGTSFTEEFSPPDMINFKIGTSDNSEIQNHLSNSTYEVSVEIRGPALNSDIKGNIGSILSDENIADKMAAISDFINGILSSMSDPKNAKITQYYYNPFSLYDMHAVQWNDKKQKQLVKINEKVLALSVSKSALDKLTNPDGVNYVSTKFDKDVAEFPNRDQYKTTYIQTYNTILPTISNYKTEVDTTLKYLEKVYTKCSNIFCNLDSVCGATGPYEEKVIALTSKIKGEISKMSKIKHEAWLAASKENSKPECEKEGVGYVTVVNVSTNPYDFYNGDTYIERLPAKSNLKFEFKPGNYNLRAVQVSGYMMYATVNNRNVTIEKTCSEATIKVGFAD